MASIRRKTNSRFWFACFTLPDGSRTQRSTKTTDRKAAQKLADQFEEASRTPLTESQARRVIGDIHKMFTGKALPSPTVRSYLAQWLATRRGSIAASSVREYQVALDQFVGLLGDRADSDIAFVTVSDVADFRDRTAASLSVASTNKRLKIVRAAFQQAWRDGMCEESPAAKVPTLKAAQGGVERRAFRVDELRRLLAAADGEWKGIILFGLYTGQRLGDIVRLRWENLDLENTTLSLSTRKTARRQIIPIAKPLVRWIEELSGGGASSGAVFPVAGRTAEGNSNVGTLSNQFNALMAKAGVAGKRSHQKTEGGRGRGGRRSLSELSFHCLRHTATSLMKNAGISPAIVQEFVGHDSKAVSQSYTHIETGALRKAADALPDLFDATVEGTLTNTN